MIKDALRTLLFFTVIFGGSFALSDWTEEPFSSLNLPPPTALTAYAAEEPIKGELSIPPTAPAKKPATIRKVAPLPEIPVSPLAAQSVPMLLYHGIGECADCMSQATFREEMKSLHDAGWHTITFAQFSDFVKRGARVPDKSFVLTFDDGRSDSYYPVDPILQEMKFTAVMYVVTDFSMPQDEEVSNFYLDTRQLQEMVRSGRWELQSHGKADHDLYSVPKDSSGTTRNDGHFLSNKFWLEDKGRMETVTEYTERIRNDLQTSHNQLVATFGKPIESFAYPFNDFGQYASNNPEARSILSRIIPSIYSFGIYETWPGNGDTFNYPDEGSMIRRLEPERTWSGVRLLAELESGRAKNLPYSSTTFEKEWVATWGQASGGTTLKLSPTHANTGATALLNGSGGWKNYEVSGTFNWTDGEVSLIARHKNSENYLTCTFSENQTYLENHTGGSRQVLAQSDWAGPSSKNAALLGMRVLDSHASCLGNGAEIVKAEFQNPHATQGGIGIQVWDEAAGVAGVEVLDINAKQL